MREPTFLLGHCLSFFIIPPRVFFLQEAGGREEAGTPQKIKWLDVVCTEQWQPANP